MKRSCCDVVVPFCCRDRAVDKPVTEDASNGDISIHVLIRIHADRPRNNNNTMMRMVPSLLISIDVVVDVKEF